MSGERYSTQRQHITSHRKAQSQVTPHQVPHTEERLLALSPIIQANAEGQAIKPNHNEKQGLRRSFTPDSEHFLASKEAGSEESDVDSQDKQREAVVKQMRELFVGQPISSENSQFHRKQSSSHCCIHSQPQS